MVHRDLPAGQEIEVPEAAVDGHRASGWITKEEAAAAEAGTATPAAAPSAAPSTPPAPSRRTSIPSGQDKE
jgi:hypothetical protein